MFSLFDRGPEVLYWTSYGYVNLWIYWIYCSSTSFLQYHTEHFQFSKGQDFCLRHLQQDIRLCLYVLNVYISKILNSVLNHSSWPSCSLQTWSESVGRYVHHSNLSVFNTWFYDIIQIVMLNLSVDCTSHMFTGHHILIRIPTCIKICIRQIHIKSLMP